jgi:hypothetical protein
VGEWHVLRLRVEKRPAIWTAAANILNRQLQTADKGWFVSFRVGRGTNNSSLQYLTELRNNSQGLGLGTIIWHENDVTQDTNRWRALVNAI